MEPIGPRLKKFRKQREFSAALVARRMGVPVSTYRRWEAGGVIAGEPYVKLARVLGVSLYELFGAPAPNKLLKDDVEKIEEILQRMKSYA